MHDEPDDDLPMLSCPLCGDSINWHSGHGCRSPKPAPERYCTCRWTPNGIAWWTFDHGRFVTR